MKRMRKGTRNNRGSALLVSLMVMVGLSLLGLGFVAISETESSISVNERNYIQVLGVAESGSRLVLEWFQDPVWADEQGLLPANNNAVIPAAGAIKRTRTSIVGAATYSGVYKPFGGLLFDKPHRPQSHNRFFGTATQPDIEINATTSATFLATVNAALFDDLTNGQITDIRIYAPPVIGGAINGQGWWEGGTRYGLATIQVTASKMVAGRAVATRVVRTVISEWPFPGPQGPVQSNANISTGGNFGVHWGRMTSEGTMDIKRPWVGIPWFDAWNSIHFEYGYFADNQDSLGRALDATNLCHQFNWLYKLQNQPLEDPWYQARAKGLLVDNQGDPRFDASITHPYKFDHQNDDMTAVPDAGYSNWFQQQNVSVGPGPCGTRNQQLVIFPKIDYEFWKNLSQSASTTNSGVKYLRWVDGEDYTDGITVKTFAEWVNTHTGAKAGFYFFDSRNGLNPQGSAPPGILAPSITVNSSDDGNTLLMKGFVYLNTEAFGTTGINGPELWYNFPGEPFRDIGYHEVNEDTLVYTVNPDGSRNITGGGTYKLEADGVTKVVDGEGTGEFEYQELNENGVLDIFLAERTVNVPGPGTPSTFWFPVPWFPGCIPGFNGDSGGSANCSEPHEPYLNLVYPKRNSANLGQACCEGGGAPKPLTPLWENPASFRKLPKVKDSAGDPITCSAGVDKRCTSNSYDRDGPLTSEFGGNSSPILDGVLYNEGAFDTHGNANYFGSILINGNILGTGTPEVWFDEYLIKGGWQDKFKELPRVFVTAHETEQ